MGLRLVVLTILLSAIGDVAAQSPVERNNRQPNVVFILVDDLAWSDLGCYGHAWHRTPNMDRLATESVRLTNAYAPAPICSASRASILTGKAVPRLRFEFVTKNDPGHQQIDVNVPLVTPPLTLNLPLSETTIGEALGSLGYHTAFFGKWHVSQHYRRVYNAWHPDFGPRKQGFAVAIEDFGDHPYGWSKQQRRNPPPLPNGQFAEDTMVAKVVDFIGEAHRQPFFVMASSFYVHTPILNRAGWLVEQYESRIPQDAANRKQRLQYAAFLETLDHHVGKILDAVEASALRDDTVILFWSDNGGHPEYTGNAPLRGSKWNLYEGGIRVPAMIRYPRRQDWPSVCDTPVIGYDILPTLMELAGGASSQVDGESFLPALVDRDWQATRPLIWHFPYYHPETTYSQAIESIGVDDFQVSKTRPQSAIRAGNHKLIHFYEDDRVELYDLQDDVSEQIDLADARPELTAQLKQQLTAELNRMNARHASPKLKQ